MKEYCFGIDVGGTTVKMGLFRTDGTLLDKWEIPTRTENGGEAILPDIAASALGRLEKMGLTKEMVEGIGIDVPGPINEEGVVPHTANLGWGYKEVTRELEELTGLKCRAGKCEGDKGKALPRKQLGGHQQASQMGAGEKGAHIRNGGGFS